MTPSEPVCLKPWLRPMPWGGTRLCDWFDGDTAGHSIGEAWLLSDHPLHQSQLLWNNLSTLHELLKNDITGALGTSRSTRFPLLIKLLDAQQNLSIQVHPNDQQAKRWSPQDGGKTEAWHVLAADPGAAIYLGIKQGIDRLTFERELASGNVVLCLNRFEPKPGETYFVPAGTVHALGQGVVVLEVQQTSDATYRLYDWDRLGNDGKPRHLHLEAGLACTQLAPDNAGLQQPQQNPDGSELLVKCPYFTIRRWRQTENASIHAPAILVPWGNSARFMPDAQLLPQGHACLLPERMDPFTIHLSPDTTLFEIRWITKD